MGWTVLAIIDEDSWIGVVIVIVVVEVHVAVCISFFPTVSQICVVV